MSKEQINAGPQAAMYTPRYSGFTTFMRTPIHETPEGLDIAFVGVPFDIGVTIRPGTRLGPRDIRNASPMMRAIHPTFRVNPYEVFRVGDVGDVPFSSPMDLMKSLDDITDFYGKLVAAKVRPISAGGDHLISLPILRALAKDGPVGMVHIDAHTDTWDEFMGNKYNHGAPFRRAVEEGLLDPKRCVQIGIRGAQNTTEGWEYSEKVGMRVVFMDEFVDRGVKDVMEEARRIVGSKPTYLTFDIDSMDPSIAPGTGAPEIGGFSSIEVQRMIRSLEGVDLIGADVVEVAPAFDQTGATALCAATVMYEMLAVMAATKARTQKA